MPKYKSKADQQLFDGMIELAKDANGPMYFLDRDGRGKFQHRGATHRCAFWDGFNDYVSVYSRYPGYITQAWICYQAGKEFAKWVKKTGFAVPPDSQAGEGILRIEFTKKKRSE